MHENNLYLKTALELQQVDVATYTEVIIHAPAKVVWGYLNDERMAKYSPAKYHLESGTWGAIGSVFSSHSLDGGNERPFPKIRYKVINCIPYKHFVWRMSKQLSSDAIETFMGYDIVVLVESNDATKLMFIQPFVLGNLNLAKGTLPAFREGQGQFIRPIFEDLKRLVEREYRH
jgi:hypothetical protein